MTSNNSTGACDWDHCVIHHSADRTATEPRPSAVTAFRLLMGEVEAWWPDRHTRLANDLLIKKFDAALAEAEQGVATRAEGLPLDTRPCSVECCDAQRVRHVHEGTHENHTGDGKWCIDCDVVIGQAGEHVSREGAAPLTCSSCGVKVLASAHCHDCYWRMVERGDEGAAPRAEGLHCEGCAGWSYEDGSPVGPWPDCPGVSQGATPRAEGPELFDDKPVPREPTSGHLYHDRCDTTDEKHTVAAARAEGLICAACGQTDSPVVMVPLHPRCDWDGAGAARRAEGLDAMTDFDLSMLKAAVVKEEQRRYASRPSDERHYKGDDCTEDDFSHIIALEAWYARAEKMLDTHTCCPPHDDCRDHCDGMCACC